MLIHSVFCELNLVAASSAFAWRRMTVMVKSPLLAWSARTRESLQQ